jgi:La-related protein 7
MFMKESAEVNTLTAALVKQLEFYFSDDNLATDTFMQHEMDSQGMVKTHVLCKFNRMKKLLKKARQDPALFPTMMQHMVPLSEVLMVSADGKEVGRKVPFDTSLIAKHKKDKEDAIAAANACAVIVSNVDATLGEHDLRAMFEMAGPIGAWTKFEKKSGYPPPKELPRESGDPSDWIRIDYKTREGALRAVERLHNGDNWRTGMRVVLLTKEKKGKIKKEAAPPPPPPPQRTDTNAVDENGQDASTAFLLANVDIQDTEARSAHRK